MLAHGDRMQTAIEATHALLCSARGKAAVLRPPLRERFGVRAENSPIRPLTLRPSSDPHWRPSCRSRAAGSCCRGCRPGQPPGSWSAPPALARCSGSPPGEAWRLHTVCHRVSWDTTALGEMIEFKDATALLMPLEADTTAACQDRQWVKREGCHLNVRMSMPRRYAATVCILSRAKLDDKTRLGSGNTCVVAHALTGALAP